MKKNRAIQFIAVSLFVSMLFPGKVFATLEDEIKAGGGSVQKGKTIYTIDKDGHIKSEIVDFTEEEKNIQDTKAREAAEIEYLNTLSEALNQVYIDTYNQISVSSRTNQYFTESKTDLYYDANTDKISDPFTGNLISVEDYAKKIASLESGQKRYTNQDGVEVYINQEQNSACTMNGCLGNGFAEVTCEGGDREEARSATANTVCAGITTNCTASDPLDCEVVTWDEVFTQACLARGGSDCYQYYLDPGINYPICQPTELISMGISCGNGGTLSSDGCGGFICSDNSPGAESGGN